MNGILRQHTVRTERSPSGVSEGENEPQTVEQVLIDTLVQLFVERPSSPSKVFHQLIHDRLYGKSVADEVRKSTVFHETLMTLINPPPKPKKKRVEIDEDGNEIEVEDDEDEEEVEEDDDDEDKPKVADILGEAKMLEAAGIGLSHQEIYALARAMKGIAETRKPVSIRFFGKIFGLKKNYYVLELQEVPKEEEEEEQEEEDEDEEEGKEETKPKSPYPPPENHGIGANVNTYLVSNCAASPPDQWILLPHSTPETVLVARKIKTYFTGNLDARVPCHPPFPGRERDYLRAQIARIWASTTIAPAGYMALQDPEEDDDEDESEGDSKGRIKYIKAPEEIPAIEPNEEYDPLKLILNKRSNWVHIAPTLLHSQGRCTLYRPEGEETDDDDDDDEDDDDEDGEGKKKRKKKPEPEMVLPLLSSISLEEPLVPRYEHNKSRSHIKSLVSWVIKSIIHENRRYSDQKLSVVRSTRWPGAYCVSRINSRQQLQFVNVYIGYGHKASLDAFSPALALPVQEENTVEDDEGNRVRTTEAHIEQADPTVAQMAEFIEPEKPPTPRDEDEDEEEEGEGDEDDEDGDEEDEDDEDED